MSNDSKQDGFWKKIERLLNMDLIPARAIQSFLDWLYGIIGAPLLFLTGFRSRNRLICDLCLQWRLMCRNRLPLVEGLLAMARSEGSLFRESLLADLSECMRQGLPLSAACRRHPIYFSPFFCNVVEAGERAGNLEGALQMLYEWHLDRWSLRRRILDSLTYPVTLLVLSSFLYWVILVFIIPRLVEFYYEAGATLPAYTQVVVHVSAFLVQSWQWILMGAIVALIILSMVTRIYPVRLFLHGLLWRIPVWGALDREESLAIFGGALKVLLGGGLPLPQAAREATGIVPNLYFQYRAGDLETLLSQGRSLADALDACGVIDARGLWHLRLGQWREALPETLDEMVFAQRQRQELHIRFAAIVEPLAILCIGVIQASMAASIYLPLFYIAQLVVGPGE
jgi:type IV pilus assembly protein PilC